MPFSIARGATISALVVVALGFVRDAGAVGTRTFVLDSLDKLSGGDLKGVAVSSDGHVRAGFSIGTAPIPEAAATFSALPLSDGTVLVGTSPQGKVYRLVGDTISLFAETGALAVTSMVQSKNGTVFAATIPDGKIFRISQSKAEVFTTLPETSHVWSIVLDRAGTGLFAATGPEGRIFHVEANGSSSAYYRSTEGHLVSLALAENGDLLAGSSGKGQLLRIAGPGRATVLADLPGEEVKGIAVGRGGVIWAIANEYGELPEAPKRSANAAHAAPGPTQGTRPKAGKGQLFRFDTQGRPERMMKHDDTHYLALSLDEHGVPFVGTGADGRVYTVEDNHVVTLVADTDERQVGALFVSGAKGFIATSDPPVMHRIVGRGADSVWTSKVLDAGLKARFGTLTWRSTGSLEFSTRTGNTESPDGTWSAWGTTLTSPGPIPSPAARFFQVRARWSRDPNAVLTDVTIPFITENIRPVVTEVNAASKGAPAREPSTAAIVASGAEIPKHDSVVKVSWKVDNPDSDALRYRVAFRREGQNLWRDALKSDEVFTKTELEWDTAALPEGKYRVRIEASDEPANPPDQVQKHAMESDSVLVDNTPPRFESLDLNGRRLRARVVDGTSPIARIEIAVDGKLEWKPLSAADGIFDTPTESIDFDAASLIPPGAHVVVLRAFDSAGNAVTRDVESK